MLTPSRVKAFYDSFGARQDDQGFYVDAALETLRTHADFPAATRIVEFGCGTGRFAREFLAAAPGATYVGFDVSSTMHRLATTRLADVGERASVRLVPPGTIALPLPDRSADRVVTTYVLDLLPEPAIGAFLDEARRLLAPGGLLCAVSLAQGRGPLTRVVSAGWTTLFRLRPSLVGGCRPIDLETPVRATGWTVVFRTLIARWGITSEVLVARPQT